MHDLLSFRFTSAIRAGFRFEGAGKISVGGGEEIWVYLNRVLVLEVTSNPANPAVPCKTIDIAAAAQKGVSFNRFSNQVWFGFYVTLDFSFTYT